MSVSSPWPPAVESWDDVAQHLPDLLSQLHVTMCRQDRMSRQSGSGSVASERLVFRVDAQDVRWRIIEVLRRIALVRDREAGVTRFEMRSTQELLVVVLGHLPWVRKHAGADAWLADLAQMMGQGWAVVDRPPDLVLLGQCGRMTEAGRCSAELWHEPDQDTVVCPLCGAVVDVHARRDASLKRAAQVRAPLSTVVSMLSSAGLRITLDQARKWTQRKDEHGRPILAPVAKRPSDGVALYEVGAVRAASKRMSKRARAS